MKLFLGHMLQLPDSLFIVHLKIQICMTLQHTLTSHTERISDSVVTSWPFQTLAVRLEQGIYPLPEVNRYLYTMYKQQISYKDSTILQENTQMIC